MAKVFAAQYPGRCASCGQRIEEGDQITYEFEEIVHEECASEIDESHLMGNRLTTIGRKPAPEVKHPGNPAQTFLE